jgi:hypothetical protein
LPIGIALTSKNEMVQQIEKKITSEKNNNTATTFKGLNHKKAIAGDF